MESSGRTGEAAPPDRRREPLKKEWRPAAVFVRIFSENRGSPGDPPVPGMRTKSMAALVFAASGLNFRRLAETGGRPGARPP